jgi:hypothetical protein
MATDVKKIATAVVIALIGVMIGYVLFNALFTPANTAVTSLNTTLQGSGYSTEADLAVTAWQIYLLAIPLVLLGGAVFMIVNAFRDKA